MSSWKYLIIAYLMCLSCKSRTVKHTGLNDLVVGVHQVVLYENGEFYLELGAGGRDGNYTIKNDTIFLSYHDEPEKWPKALLMTDNYFITIYADKNSREIKIKRNL